MSAKKENMAADDLTLDQRAEAAFNAAVEEVHKAKRAERNTNYGVMTWADAPEELRELWRQAVR